MINVSTAHGREGIVVAGHALAAEAGRDVLRGGGNAVDAAVAAAAVLTVVCPYACTLGGDVFALIFDAKDGRVGALNGSGVAPAKASLDSYGGRIPQTGAGSISIPGFVAGIEDMLARSGTLPLAALIGPAIALADGGFPAHSQLIRNSEQRAELIAKDKEAARLFLPGGKPYALGDIVRQPDLAASLARIAEGGARAFYEGPMAEAMAAAIAAAGGVTSVEDFCRHRGLWQDPIAVPFAGYDVLTMPPNSYGLTLLFQLLALEAEGIAGVDPASADFVVRGLAARRAAYAAADGLIGDPTELDPAARRRLAQAIAAGGRLGGGAAPAEALDRCTSCVVVLDSAGNAVSLIESISAPFGSGLVAPGTGVLFNNRMPGFSTRPGHPNVLAPGKRPAHTLAPCLVLRDGRVSHAVGTPGTVGQTCVLAQVLARILAAGESIESAIAAPRWSVTLDGTPAVEAAMEEAVRGEIAARVPDLKTMPTGWLTFGSLKIAAVTDGGFFGAADGRRTASPAAV